MSRLSLVTTRSALLAALLTGCADDGAGGSSTSGDGSTSAGSSTTSGGSSGDGTTGDAPTTSGDASTSSTGDGTTGDGTTGDGTTGDDLCAESVLTWENFGEPFVLSWCTGCHHSQLPTAQRAGAPCGVNLDTHAGASQFAPRLHVRALDWADTPGLTPMPPAAIVPEAELALLREWLDCGAPGPETGMMAPECPDP